MIRGHKPNGYTVSFDSDLKKIEAETRQCIHCQYNWSYGDPHQEEMYIGPPTRRGFCNKCQGWLCGRDECIQQQIALTGNTTDCIPFEDQVNRLRDKVHKYLPLDPDLTITPGGLIVPRSN